MVCFYIIRHGLHSYIIFLKTAVESGAADTECRSYLAQISFITFQSLKNGLTFYFIQGHAGQRRAFGCPCIIVADVLGIEIGSVEDEFAAYQYGTLYQVLQFTDISGERQTAQELHGVGGEVGVR